MIRDRSLQPLFKKCFFFLGLWSSPYGRAMSKKTAKTLCFSGFGMKDKATQNL